MFLLSIKKLLAEYLTNSGRDVLLTREPGGKGLGEKVREILLNYDGDVSDRCESFLFLADRAQNIDIIVNPAVKEGKIVLCDRHIDSTVAYQGYGRGLDIERINMLNNLATDGRKPDLTLVFDIDVETSMQRVSSEKDRMESGGIEFFNKVRNGYLTLAKQEPERIKVIDSSRSIEEVFEKPSSSCIKTILSICARLQTFKKILKKGVLKRLHRTLYM